MAPACGGDDTLVLLLPPRSIRGSTLQAATPPRVKLTPRRTSGGDNRGRLTKGTSSANHYPFPRRRTGDLPRLPAPLFPPGAWLSRVPSTTFLPKAGWCPPGRWLTPPRSSFPRPKRDQSQSPISQSWLSIKMMPTRRRGGRTWERQSSLTQREVYRKFHRVRK